MVRFNPLRVFNFIRRDEVIKDKLRKDKDIVYGARAMNVQLPAPYQRHTKDYDIYSKSPNTRARQLERDLDKSAGGDYYYVKPALHKGTFKVMDKGFDNRKGTYDDFNVADYSKPTRKIRTVSIFGIRYAHLSERKKDAKKSLNDPMFKFRHEKDRKDLYRIKQGNKIRRFL